MFESWNVEICSRSDIAEFIECNHYSGNINGCMTDYCFRLVHKNEVKGAMFYGRMAMANQWKRFGDKPEDVIELRRLCCIDDTPKNTESFFIGKTLKILSKIWSGKVVVSYADKEHGHSGVIYKASNFTMTREIPGAKVILHGEKRYHDKAIRTKYKGELKPFAKRLVVALKDGSAYYHKTKGKFTYVYYLDKKERKKFNK